MSTGILLGPIKVTWIWRGKKNTFPGFFFLVVCQCWLWYKVQSIEQKGNGERGRDGTGMKKGFHDSLPVLRSCSFNCLTIMPPPHFKDCLWISKCLFPQACWRHTGRLFSDSTWQQADQMLLKGHCGFTLLHSLLRLFSSQLAFKLHYRSANSCAVKSLITFPSQLGTQFHFSLQFVLRTRLLR